VQQLTTTIIQTTAKDIITNVMWENKNKQDETKDCYVIGKYSQYFGSISES